MDSIHTHAVAQRAAPGASAAQLVPARGAPRRALPPPCLRSAGTPSHGCAASLQAGRAPQFQHTADPYSAPNSKLAGC